MLTALLEVVLPVFLVAATGYLYAGWRRFPVSDVTDLIIHLTGACLVFDALTSAPRFSLSALRVPIAAVALVVGGVALAALARLLVPVARRASFSAVALPAAFMNAGNLGLPLAQLALGREGLNLAMIFFVTFSTLHYSLGVAIAKGRGGATEFLKLPLIYAAIAGVVVNQLAFEIPAALSVPVHLLGQTVVPLMLLSLGAGMRGLFDRLRGASVGDDERVPFALVALLPALRMGGGLLLALLINLALGNEGRVAQVTLLAGALPPAVLNFALVEKYGTGPKDTATVSAAIALGTLLAIGVMPAVIGLLIR